MAAKTRPAGRRWWSERSGYLDDRKELQKILEARNKEELVDGGTYSFVDLQKELLGCVEAAEDDDRSPSKGSSRRGDKQSGCVCVLRADKKLAENSARMAAERGYVFILEWLRKQGMWEPLQSSVVMNSAEECGHLLLLLTAFQLPLAQYPSLAQAFLKEALGIFKNDFDVVLHAEEKAALHRGQTNPKLLKYRDTKKRLVGLPGNDRPSQEAMLLANFLLVPSAVGETLLEQVCEDMVVFQPRPEAYHEYPTEPQFPQELGSIFVSRFYGERRARSVRYDRENQELWLPGRRTPLRVSKEYPVTLTEISRKAALIPDNAAIFTYIYYGEDFPTGGFLYCSQFFRPVCINTISFTRKDDAFCFGTYKELGKEGSAFLQATSQAVDVQELIDGGARRYAWVGPDDILPGGFTAGIKGGFAYLFDDPSMNRFFPITGAGKVLGSKVVLRSREDSVKSVPLEMNFPKRLSAIFVQREVTMQEGVAAENQQQLEYSFFGKSCFDGGHITLKGSWGPLETSPLFKLTFTEDARRAALIPLQATHFAYVKYGEAFPNGGFVYFKHNETKNECKPLAVKLVSFEGRYAISLGGSPIQVSKIVSDHLMKVGRTQEISVDALREHGAMQYAFVGPGEKLPDGFETYAGGFVYFFEDESKNVFFPLIGASEIVDRADLHTEMGCKMLPATAMGMEVENKLTRAPHWHLYLKKLLTCRYCRRQKLQRKQGTGVPVRIARLRVPDVLHPVVLHALSYTPRDEALDTVAAKAIAQEAFLRARAMLCFDISLETCSLIAIWRIIQCVRGNSLRDPVTDKLDPFIPTSICAIVVVWSKDVLQEINTFMGYHRWDWSADYFTWHKAMVWPYLMLKMASILLVLVYNHKPFPTNNPLRPLLAAVGCMMWVRLLYACRGFEVFKLGKRILPILAALGEVWNFLLIMVFFFGAFVTASYALSGPDTFVKTLLFSTYQISFLASYDVNNQVFFVDDDVAEEDYMPWSNYQYLSFVLFSFTLNIAMMNIFIGVMSNAFDMHQERVGHLFVRSRACLGLDYALRNETFEMIFFCNRRRTKASRESELLWVCYRHSDDASKSTQELTIRGALRGVTDEVGRKFILLDKKLERMESKLAKGIAEATAASGGGGGHVLPTPSGARVSLMGHAVSTAAAHQAVMEMPKVRVERVKVRIDSASGLQNLDTGIFNGTSDPYCTCQVQNMPSTFASTKTCSDTENPIWMFECDMGDVSEQDSLVFTVWDKDHLKADDLLGKAIFPCKTLFAEGIFAGDLPLVLGQSETGASIRVKMLVDERERDPDVSAQVVARETTAAGHFVAQDGPTCLPGACNPEGGGLVFQTPVPGSPSQKVGSPLSVTLG